MNKKIQAPPVQSAGPEINNKRTDEFASWYANNAAITTNFFDIGIVFGEATGLDKAGVLQVDQRCRITMSPSHVKIFALTLLDQLNRYEEKFGKISVPADLYPPELQKYLNESEGVPKIESR